MKNYGMRHTFLIIVIAQLAAYFLGYVSRDHAMTVMVLSFGFIITHTAMSFIVRAFDETMESRDQETILDPDKTVAIVNRENKDRRA